MKPTSAQEVVLDFIRLQCQQIYNAALQQRRDAWRKQRKSISYFDQTQQLTELRKADAGCGVVSSEVQRSALRRVDLAYKAFFRRCKSGEKPGFPRFKSHKQYNSFSFPDAPRAPIIKGRYLQIPSFGSVELNLYRNLQGNPLEAKVVKDSLGKWWACFVCDLGQAPPKVEIKNSAGVDVGLTHFATYHDGSKDENSRFYKRSEELLAVRQRKLAHKRKPP